MASPNQQALMSVIRLLLSGMSNSNRAFYQKYGKEALPVIVATMNQTGVEWSKLMQQISSVRTMQSVAEQWQASGAMMGMGTEIVGSSDSSFHFRQSHCALGLEGTSRELCEAMMTVDKSRVSTFLGREVEMSILKTRAAGDEKCDVAFSAKS